MTPYRAPWWLPGGHLQTIAAALSPAPRVAFTRETWETPDGDFIEVDRAGVAGATRLLVLFHGLEGSSQSHYARALAVETLARGWNFALPHFRGCSGKLNRLPRAYHSGDTDEVDWILQKLKAEAAIGISLGGNGSRRDTLGILVVGVSDSGPAARAGIDEGDRIAAIGDSCTFGKGVDESDTWPRQLERNGGRVNAAFAPLEAKSQDVVRGILQPLSPAEQDRLLASMRSIHAILNGSAGGKGTVTLRTHRYGDMAWIVARQDRAWYAAGRAKNRLKELGQTDDQVYNLDGDWSEFTPAERAEIDQIMTGAASASRRTYNSSTAATTAW